MASDATQLGNEKLSGNGSTLKLTLVDKANLSNLIATKFKVIYQTTRSQDVRFRPVSDFTTRFEGEIPAEQIERTGDRFTLNLGQLPIPPDYLKAGVGVEVEITANRSFAGNSANQKIVVRDIIPAFR